ncbi:TlpA family protein disulfide reductase [Nonlabens sp.]|uniref:TlpA family protein disulfide reductase n=1 Tax=Nonlabens sp. TaxID=1888209 RepID=UPI003F6954C4
MKKTFILPLLIIAIVACNDQQNIEKAVSTAIISGKITAVDSIGIPDKLTAYRYNNSIADYDEIEITVTKNGSFKKTIEVNKPMSIAVYGDYGTQLILSPGDSVHLNTSARFKNISYSGIGGSINKSLASYKENNPTKKLMQNWDQLDLSQFSIQLDSSFQIIKKYNSDFLAQNNDPIIKTYVESEEQFFIPAFKLNYALFALKGEQALSDSIFLNDLNNLPLYKEGYDINNNHPSSTAMNLGYLWKNHATDKENESAREKAFMNGLLKLKNNDYLKQKIAYLTVMGQFADNNISFYERYRTEIKSILEGEPQAHILNEKYTEIKKLLDNPVIPEDAELLTFKTQDPTQFIDEIIANAEGKVIYIDNWATWCGPCKSEFKSASPKLHEKFKDDVEFVYLCHNSKKAGFIPSIAKYKIAGKHYFLEDAQSRPIFKQIDLEGFPTYTIINKKGEIVLSDYIHRPSYAKTTEILTGLINE